MEPILHPAQQLASSPNVALQGLQDSLLESPTFGVDELPPLRRVETYDSLGELGKKLKLSPVPTTATDLDLRLLEDDCRRRMDRCAEYQETVTRLEREISADVAEWDLLLSQLAEADSNAAVLTDQIQSSLRTLREAAEPQLTEAERVIASLKHRIEATRASKEHTERVIEQAKEMVPVIEERVTNERAMQAKMEGYSFYMKWLAWTAFGLVVYLMLMWSVELGALSRSVLAVAQAGWDQGARSLAALRSS